MITPYVIIQPVNPDLPDKVIQPDHNSHVITHTEDNIHESSRQMTLPKITDNVIIQPDDNLKLDHNVTLLYGQQGAAVFKVGEVSGVRSEKKLCRNL